MKRFLVALVLAVVLSLALASSAFAVEVPCAPEGEQGIDMAAGHGAPVSYEGME